MASISPARSIRKVGLAFGDRAELLCSVSVLFCPCCDVGSEVSSFFAGDRCGLLGIDCCVKLARLGSVILLVKVGMFASCRVGVVGPCRGFASLVRLCSGLVGDPSKRYAKEMTSLVYASSLPQERDLFVPDDLREDHPKLGSFGAAELTIECHCPEVRAGSCASSVLVAGVDRDLDCESVELIETPESLLPSREDGLEFSPDDAREDITDTHEFLRSA